MMIKKISMASVALAALTVVGACTPTQQGAAVGAGTGAVIGGVTTGSVTGAAVGAAVGGVGGAIIGQVAGQPEMCWWERPNGTRYQAPCDS